jgi:hypothetical protein
MPRTTLIGSRSSQSTPMPNSTSSRDDRAEPLVEVRLRHHVEELLLDVVQVLGRHVLAERRRDPGPLARRREDAGLDREVSFLRAVGRGRVEDLLILARALVRLRRGSTNAVRSGAT